MSVKKVVTTFIALTFALSALAQVDRSEVRAGNRKYLRHNYKEAEIDYRKALVKDSLSITGSYNLASTLYRMQDYDGAGKAMEAIKETAPQSAHSADWWYNTGDIALQKKDYAAAVEAFKHSLLERPSDMDAKENYLYAKLMLQNQQNDENSDNKQDRDQDNDQNQNQDQNQNNDSNQDNNDNQSANQDQQQQPKISPQQVQQMLQAIQAKEKETQDKVNKEKAAALKSRQKDKNW